VDVGRRRAEQPDVVAAHDTLIIETSAFTIELDHSATCPVDPIALYMLKAEKRFIAEFNARFGLLE
jgi:hypothetical protein